MFPKVILHNSMSLDGSFLHFETNMGMHYQIVINFKAQGYLVGSVTAKTGLEMSNPQMPEEKTEDRVKPRKDHSLMSFVIVDSKGVLKNCLHLYRRFEFCRDVIVLVSETTPRDYINYLEERQYDYIQCGKDKVDLSQALELLQKNFEMQVIVADTGKTLGNELLNQGLVSEVSLLIHPELVGEKGMNLFSTVIRNQRLRLLQQKIFEKQYIWLHYVIERRKE